MDNTHLPRHSFDFSTFFTALDSRINRMTEYEQEYESAMSDPDTDMSDPDIDLSDPDTDIETETETHGMIAYIHVVVAQF